MTWFPSCRDPDTKFKICNNDDVWHALYKVKVQSYDSVCFLLKGSLLLDKKGTVLSDINGHCTICLRKKYRTGQSVCVSVWSQRQFYSNLNLDLISTR